MGRRPNARHRAIHYAVSRDASRRPGQRPTDGTVVALASGISAWYFFVRSSASPYLEWPSGYLIMALFAITAAIQLYVVSELNGWRMSSRMSGIARRRYSRSIGSPTTWRSRRAC